MLRLSNPLHSFLLHVLLWVPGVFYAWYQLATAIVWPVASLSRWALVGLFPDWITAVEQPGRVLDVVTNFAPPQGPAGALLVMEINPLIYGYGVALFMALTLAARGIDWGTLGRLAAGVLILAPFQAWGVCFDVLKSLAFNLGPEVAGRMALSDWQREAIALGYQFGYLILPGVTAVALWMVFNRGFLQSLVQGPEQSAQA